MVSEPKWDRKIITIPNLLSLCRLLLIPVMIHFYLDLHRPSWTIALLGVSGLTDVADGWIARRFNMISDLGKMLDPLADKLTQFALLGCLLVQHIQLIYVFVLLAIKDVCMAIVGLVVIKRTKRVNSSIWHGKLCTVVVYVSLLILFVFPEVSDSVVWALSLASMAAICLSFLLYMLHYYGLLQQQKRQQS